MADSKTVFRRKTVERVSSPEQLTDYLRVTNLGIWVLLSAVILVLSQRSKKNKGIQFEIVRFAEEL